MSAPAGARTRARGPLNVLLLALLGATAFTLLLWGGEALFHLARQCRVSAVWAWVPSVSTSGVMLLSTAIAMQHRVAEKIRRWAWSLASFGIVADIAAAGGEHVMAMQPGPLPTPSPWWGMAIGGLPSLMGGILIHVVSMVYGQWRREQRDLDAATDELDTAESVRKANALAEERAADARLVALRGEAAAATRLRQAAATDRDTAATAAATALRQRSQAEQDLAAARVARDEAEEQVSAAEKDYERARSKQRRATAVAATERPLSRPVAAAAASVSRPAVATSTPEQRREWTLDRLRRNVVTTGADINAEFGLKGSARDGHRVLKWAQERVNVVELRAAGGHR